MSINNPQQLENKIMSEIKSGRLKLRSKYIFLAEKLGLSGVFVLSIILAVLFFNLALFYMKATDNLGYLSFGYGGILAFLESFPYLLIVSLIFVLLLAGYLMKKSDFSYKKPFSYLIVGLLLLVIFIGGILTYTDLPESIENKIYNGHPVGGFLRPLLGKGMDAKNKGIAGVIFEKDDNYLIIQTPLGLEKINLRNIIIPQLPEFQIGQFVIAVGDRCKNEFSATDIKLIKGDRLPILRRGINRQFDPYFGCTQCATNTLILPPHLLRFDDDTNNCLQQCNQLNKPRQECFHECIK